MTQFEPKIKKIRVCTFQMSGKIRDSTNVAFEEPLFAIFGPARGQTNGKMAEKMLVLARRALQLPAQQPSIQQHRSLLVTSNWPRWLEHMPGAVAQYQISFKGETVCLPEKNNFSFIFCYLLAASAAKK